jgi:hypothetical protein
MGNPWSKPVIGCEAAGTVAFAGDLWTGRACLQSGVLLSEGAFCGFVSQTAVLTL